MRPPSKSKTWGNEDATAQEFGANFSTEEVVVPALEAPSEDEYQSVPEMTKNPKKMVSAKPETEKPSDNNSCEKDLRVLTAAVAPTQAETSESVNKTGAATDDEWLRSRTSRLLGLVDDDELDGQLEAQTRSITRTEESTTATNPIEKSDIPSPIAPPAPENEEVEATSPAQPAEDPDIILIEETRRLFIRNLPYGASEDDLSQYFSSKGELSEVSSTQGSFFLQHFRQAPMMIT
jgi:multiple RNA-binding domain-containing protein 1